MNKIIKYVIIDILRSKIVLAYTLLLLVISFSVFSLEGNSTKGLLSLLNLILFIVPLVSVIFSTIYMYNSTEFIEYREFWRYLASTYKTNDYIAAYGIVAS